MGIFRRKRIEPEPFGPTPFIAEVLRRLGEEYGGFDVAEPLSPDRGGPGGAVTIHIAGDVDPAREPFMQGTGTSEPLGPWPTTRRSTTVIS
ncbi:hypothetical protein F8O01_16875 [Pseudoclavibacter chungangensis]|uniref:Uncharacterized protein n=1 Tax=Pseudoclavibacter chungangensis TaxID=587635 RepID=A0A7J5BM58_9MICO|nr:hypothetical protein [Pseudoclavibacter chungangensis]KAB1652301.1 hypothetical protein F8O01_16875 [Pseudoclavibacter chungangensis]NYJ66917.1 arginase family enzyme [Pseudoclavibacter chungangensis]